MVAENCHWFFKGILRLLFIIYYLFFYLTATGYQNRFDDILHLNGYPEGTINKTKHSQNHHLCPEMHATTKMMNVAKFRQASKVM